MAALVTSGARAAVEAPRAEVSMGERQQPWTGFPRRGGSSSWVGLALTRSRECCRVISSCQDSPEVLTGCLLCSRAGSPCGGEVTTRPVGRAVWLQVHNRCVGGARGLWLGLRWGSGARRGWSPRGRALGRVGAGGATHDLRPFRSERQDCGRTAGSRRSVSLARLGGEPSGGRVPRRRVTASHAEVGIGENVSRETSGLRSGEKWTLDRG